MYSDHEIDIDGYKSLVGIMMQIIGVLLGYPAKQGWPICRLCHHAVDKSKNKVAHGEMQSFIASVVLRY